MAEVKIDEGISKPLIGGTSKEPSWLQAGISIIREVNTLINTINNNPFVQRFAQKDNMSNVLQSGTSAKSIKMNPQPQKLTAQEPPAQDLKAFFSTPEGLNTIVEAIDQITPIIGDVKLSEVKNLIQNVGGNDNAESGENRSKNANGSNDKKPKGSRKTTGKKSKRSKT